jgi:hypothetical protein
MGVQIHPSREYGGRKGNIRKKKIPLQRSVTFDVLEAFVRILALYLALKCIEPTIRNLHAAVALERYI